MNSYEEIDSIHKSTIIRCLKKDMNFSYKRLERRPAPSTTPEAVRKTLEGALVQQKLEERKVELIFMDEFSVNTRRDKFFGWGKKGWKRYIKTDSNDFSMSFIWALSSRWVFWIFGWNGSITSDEIKYYVKCLASNRNESQEIDDRDFILVYDNARVHVSEAMKEFIQKSKLRSIGIPTYWPVLDPCEKLINATKQHLKSIHESGK